MRSSILSGVCVLVLAASSALAQSWTVRIDVSSLVLQDIQIEFSLYDNSDVIGDSLALIDNVRTYQEIETFEGGSLGQFDVSLNPQSIAAVPGQVAGYGGYVMQIAEDPVHSPTIAFRNFSASDAHTIAFDFEFTTTSEEGSMGRDQLVVSVLKPSTLTPLLPGLTSGLGDVLAIDGDGFTSTPYVTITPTPEPLAAMLLLGAIPLGLRRRR